MHASTALTCSLAHTPWWQVAASALIFLYNHLDALGEPARLESLSWLHTRFTFFALHWSRVVRTIYFHIVVIRVLHWTPPATSSPSRRSVSADFEALFGGQHRVNEQDAEKLEKLLARERTRATKSLSNLDAASHSCGDLANGSRSASSDGGSSHGLNGHATDGGGRSVSLGNDGGGVALHERGGSNRSGCGSRNASGSFNSLSSNSSLHNMIPTSTSYSSMRDVEFLLEFHRLRDLYTDSISSLDVLAKVAQASMPSTANGAGYNGHAGARGRGRAGRAAKTAGRGRGRGREGGAPGARTLAAPTEADGAANGTNGVASDDEGKLSEAMKELGLGESGSVGSRRALGYAAYAWGEYEQVVRKWEAAAAALAPAVDVQARGEGLRDGQGATVGKLARSSSTGTLGAPEASSIRRVGSEPTLAPTPNPLALSLSMITSHVHDDDDDAGEIEEW